MASTTIPATGTGWDETTPDKDQPHGKDYNEIIEVKKAVRIRSNKEHVAFGTTSAGGEHKPGSAVCYIADFTSGLPTKRPDATSPWTSGGTELAATDIGRIAYDTASGKSYILTNHSPVTWTEHVVNMTSAQTIAGAKTFSSVIKTIDPVDAQDVATKAYSDWKSSSTVLLNSGHATAAQTFQTLSTGIGRIALCFFWVEFTGSTGNGLFKMQPGYTSYAWSKFDIGSQYGGSGCTVLNVYANNGAFLICPCDSSGNVKWAAETNAVTDTWSITLIGYA